MSGGAMKVYYEYKRDDIAQLILRDLAAGGFMNDGPSNAIFEHSDAGDIRVSFSSGDEVGGGEAKGCDDPECEVCSAVERGREIAQAILNEVREKRYVKKGH